MKFVFYAFLPMLREYVTTQKIPNFATHEKSVGK